MPADRITALDRAFELAGRLAELMQEALAARGLTVSQAHVLHALDDAGPLVQRQLAEHLRRTPRHVTTLVDALESAGLVTRAAHPTDRRATLVVLTKNGQTATARMRAERTAAAEALLADSTPSDLAGFVATADALLRRLDDLVGERSKDGA